MKLFRSKIFIFAVVAVMILFFSNDFGLIDVEKTAIITAVSIDMSGEEYEVTAQIAVPEATDTNSEDKKALISSKGKTIGGALKEISNLSGWFPKLSFCNLIIIGDSLAQTNTIKVLDYFAKTLRVQDSATLILAEKSAKELLEKSSPLDNISSFALQKILLKNPGFDKNVATVDIKTFCSDYYSKDGSSRMPLVKIIELNKEDSSQGGSESNSSSTQKNGNGGGDSGSAQSDKCVFDATTTALFKDGVKVGELNGMQTIAYNLLHFDADETTISVDNVDVENQKKANYLVTILRNSRDIKVKADESGLNVDISLDIYCRISDHNKEGSDNIYIYNTPLPENVIKSTEKLLTENINDIITTQRQTECDILKIKEKIYRKNHKFYASYKDNYSKQMNTTITVKVNGPK